MALVMTKSSFAEPIENSEMVGIPQDDDYHFRV
jgi:hypothetical protein